MQFTLSGKPYDVDLDHITVKEMRLLKEHAGLAVATMAAGIMQGDADALVAMVYLAKSRAGEAVRWQDLDDLDVVQLVEQLGTTQYRIMAVALGPENRRVERLRALADALEQEAAAEKADPTAPAAAPSTASGS